MTRSRPISLRILVACALVAFVAATLGVVTWRNHRFLSRQLQEQVSASLAANILSARTQLDALLADRLDAVRSTALNPRVLAVARGDVSSIQDARFALQTLVRHDPLHNIAATIVDSAGRVQFSTSPLTTWRPSPGDNALAFPTARTMTDSSGTPVEIVFVAAVRDAAGTQVGLIALQTRVTALGQILSQLAGSIPAYALLRLREHREDGRLIIGWPIADVRANVQVSPWHQLQSDEVDPSNRWRLEVRDRLLVGVDNDHTMVETAVDLQTLPWYVAIVVDRSEVANLVRGETRAALMFSAGVLVLIGTLIVLIGETFAQRIVVLAQVVRRIANNDRHARVPADSHHDEVSQLGHDVNVMANTIEELIANLEARRRELEVELDERGRLEEALAASRRLESIGHLAGTVAHDFNHVVAITSTAAQSAATEIPTDHIIQEDLQEIVLAAQRGREITRRLLTLARDGEQRLDPLDVNRCIEEHQRLLRRLLPGSVALELALAPHPLLVQADHTKFVQALFNLLANARDAIGPHAGVVTIETATVQELSGHIIGVAPSRRPPYVSIVVRDTGEGMDAETLKKLGSIFFTTKPNGSGTGIGVASIASMLRDAAGTLTVSSKRGEGTRFVMVLPLLAPEAVTERVTEAIAGAAQRD